MMYKTEGYSHRSKIVSQENIEHLKEQSKEERRQRKQKVKELSKQTNAIKRRRENRIKSKEQKEEERQQKILKARKLQQQVATEKFQRSSENHHQIKKERSRRHNSNSGLNDGKYTVSGHVIEIKNGVRVSSIKKKDEIKNEDETLKDLIMSPIFQNSVYAPNTYLSNHLNNLLGEAKVPTHHPAGAIQTYKDSDIIENWNKYHLNNEKSQQDSSAMLPDPILPIKDLPIVISDQEKEEEIRAKLTRSPYGSTSSVDSLNESINVRSSLKNSSSKTMSDANKKVTFSTNIQFSDGETETIKTPMSNRIPLYKRLSNNESKEIDSTPQLTTEDLLDQLRRDALLPKYPSSNGYNYPDSVNLISNQNNIAIVSPMVLSEKSKNLSLCKNASEDIEEDSLNSQVKSSSSASLIDSLNSPKDSAETAESANGHDVIAGFVGDINDSSEALNKIEMSEKCLKDHSSEFKQLLTTQSTINTTLTVNPVYFSYDNTPYMSDNAGLMYTASGSQNRALQNGNDRIEVSEFQQTVQNTAPIESHQLGNSNYGSRWSHSNNLTHQFYNPISNLYLTASSSSDANYHPPSFSHTNLPLKYQDVNALTTHQPTSYYSSSVPPTGFNLSSTMQSSPAIQPATCFANSTPTSTMQYTAYRQVSNQDDSKYHHSPRQNTDSDYTSEISRNTNQTHSLPIRGNLSLYPTTFEMNSFNAYNKQPVENVIASQSQYNTKVSSCDITSLSQPSHISSLQSSPKDFPPKPSSNQPGDKEPIKYSQENYHHSVSFSQGALTSPLICYADPTTNQNLHPIFSKSNNESISEDHVMNSQHDYHLSNLNRTRTTSVYHREKSLHPGAINTEHTSNHSEADTHKQEEHIHNEQTKNENYTTHVTNSNDKGSHTKGDGKKTLKSRQADHNNNFKIIENDSALAPNNPKVVSHGQLVPRSLSTSDEIYKEVEKSLAHLTFENSRKGFIEDRYERPKHTPRGDLFDQSNHSQVEEDSTESRVTKDRISDAVQKGSGIPIRVHSNNSRRGRIIVSADARKRKPTNGIMPRPPSKPKTETTYTTQTKRDETVHSSEQVTSNKETPRHTKITSSNLEYSGSENQVSQKLHKRANSASAVLSRKPPPAVKQTQSQSHFERNYQRQLSNGLPVYPPNSRDNKYTMQHLQEPVKSIPLDKTPTDDEINKLWNNVRECLSNETSAYAIPGAAHVPVTDQKPHSYHQRTLSGSSLSRKTAQQPPILNRQNSNDSMSSTSSYSKRQSLLPHRASKMMRQSVISNQGVINNKQNNPMNKYSEKVTSSMVSFLALEELCGKNKQSLTPPQTEAVFQASKHMMRKHQHVEPRQGISALSIEERCVIESLDRLNKKLQEQERKGYYDVNGNLYGRLYEDNH